VNFVELILPIGKAAFFTILILKVYSIVRASRLRSVGLLWLGVSLLFWGIRLIFPSGSFARIFFVLLLLLTGTIYLSYREGKVFPVICTTLGFGFAITLALVAALGYSQHISFKIFALLCLLTISFFPGYRFFESSRGSTSWFRYFLILAAVAWFILISVAYLSPQALGAGNVDGDLWFSLVAVGVMYLYTSGIEGQHQQNQWSVYPYLKGKSLLDALARLDQRETVMLLQQRVMSTGYLTASLIHDFKNIMTYIDACADFGLSQANPAEVARSLRAIRDNVDRGSRTITALLSSLAQGRREEPTEIQIGEFLSEFLESARINYRLEGIEFLLKMAGDRRIVLRRGELEQALGNLIHNAVQAFKSVDGEGEPMIELSCHGTGSAFAIELRDNAGGLAEDVQRRLFMPPTESSPAGLGLYLAHTLIALNRGTLEFEPLEGGSCFRILFEA
jgi:signal transduction histidine kinase